MKKTIPLRPHHLLCFHYFIGKGYSDAFTKNMLEILKELQEGRKIHLVSGCDDVCLSCPHNTEGLCEKQVKVTEIDRRVTDEFKLKNGLQTDWKTVNALLHTSLNGPVLDHICGDCQWISICSKRYS